MCQNQRFYVSELKVLCVRIKGFVCQEKGFRVSKRRVLCVEKSPYFNTCQASSARSSGSTAIDTTASAPQN